MIFGNDRNQLRQAYADAFNKFKAGQPMTALEQQIAQVINEQTVFEVRVDRKNIKIGKTALKRASYKLPCGCRIIEAS